VSAIERLRYFVGFPDAKRRYVRSLTVPERESLRYQGLNGSRELGRLIEGQNESGDEGTNHADAAEQEEHV
jgi:hypothetical protein